MKSIIDLFKGRFFDKPGVVEIEIVRDDCQPSRDKPELFEDVIRGLAVACLAIFIVCGAVLVAYHGWDSLINLWRG